MTGLVASLSLAMLLAVAAFSAHGQGVYVAGQGFTLEQAVEQALSEQRGGGPFWIVAAGEEAQRVVQAEGEDVRTLLERVREHGGAVYACERNLSSGGDSEGLPDSVGVIRAPEKPGPVVVPPDVEVEPMPDIHHQRRLILRSCAALQ